jgi:glycosyltransferase involved in cell wall biosynthesis
MLTNHRLIISQNNDAEVHSAKISHKILYIMQLPPPVHGSNIMNQYVHDSELLNQHFVTDLVNLSFSKSSSDIEKFTVQKFLKVGYYAFLIIRKIIAFKPDLIYFTMAPRGFAFYRDSLYILILKVFRQNIVLHMHGKGISRTANKYFINKLICRILFKKLHTISLSEQLTQDVRDFSDHEPFIIPNGIRQTVAGKSFDRSKNEVPRILFLSNYIREKGILVLIDALSLLNQRGYDFSARLVGAPGDISIVDLNNYIKNHQLTDKTVVTGPKYAQDKIAEFQQADIFVFPTFYSNEAFPLVNLEAMQYSLPIISTNEGGIADMLVNSGAGFIVEPKNSQLLADKIATLLSDKDLREEMGSNAFHHYSRNYTLDRFETNLKRVFDQVM